jgi:hypothetical protein
MIERMDDVPAGVIGIRASGKLTKDRSAWKRFAVVTGVDWIAKSMRLFAWMVPGEVKVFDMSELDKAKEWVVT